MMRNRKADDDILETSAAALGRKRLKEYSAQDAELAKILQVLSSESEEERLDANEKLKTKIVDTVAAQGSGQVHPLVDYSQPKNIYVRLIRGCCSNRKAANLGFSTALTACLDASSEADVQTPMGPILALIESHTVPGADATRPEKRNHLRGRLSAFGAVLSCTTFQYSIGPQDRSHFTTTLDVMGKICKDSPFLQQVYGDTLHRLVIRLSKPLVTSDETEKFEAILQSVCTHGFSRTPEGIGLWIEIAGIVLHKRLPKNIWHHRDPFSKRDFSTTLSILGRRQELPPEVDPDQSTVDLTGVKQIQPSFVWGVIITHLIDILEAKNVPVTEVDARNSTFANFWMKAIDNSHFADTASTDRKSLGFQMLIAQLMKAPTWALSIMLSPRLLRCLINQCASEDRSLHSVCKKVLRALIHRAGNDHASHGPHHGSAIAIVKHLLFSDGGTAEFDKRTSRTGMKTVQSILNQVNEGPLFDILAMLEGEIETADALEADQADFTRLAYANLLLETLRSRLRSLHALDESHPKQATWPSRILSSLAKCCDKSYGHLGELERPSNKTVDTMLSRFSSGIALVVCTDNKIASATLFDTLQNLSQSETRNFEAIWASDETALTVVRRGIAQTQALSTDAQRTANSLNNAMLMLLSMAFLQAYARDTDAISLIDELCDACKNLDTTGDQNSEQLDSMIELLISFAAKPSSLYRKITEQVFGVFATGMSYGSVLSMLDVLEQRENSAGQKALFERDDEAEDVEMINGTTTSSGAKEEEDSDVEEVTGTVTGMEDGSESGSSESSDDSGVSATSADQCLDDALAIMLGTKQSTGSDVPTNRIIDDEPQSDSDASMDDDEMLALEPHLAAAFRARTNALPPSEEVKAKPPPSASAQRKKDQVAAKTNMVNFKNRVLDLLAIWLKQDPANGLTPHVVVPLLRVMRTTASKQIAEKSFCVLKAYFDAAKGGYMPVPDVVDEDEKQDSVVRDLLNEIHEEALLFGSKLHANACSRASLFMARCLLAQTSSLPAEAAAAQPDSANDTAPNGAAKMSKKAKKREKKARMAEAAPPPVDDGARVQQWEWLITLYAATQKKRRAQKSGLPAAFWRDFIDWEVSMAI